VDAVALDGDRTAAIEARDLRAGVATSGVPALVTYGLAPPRMLDGAVSQAPFEGLVMNAADLSFLPPRSHVLLGGWGHGPPTVDDFSETVVAWFDHHLRDGPDPGLPPARYQDADDAWHDAERWPPLARTLTLTFDAPRAFVSSDRSPTLEACGGDQAVWSFSPFDTDLHLAGSFRLRVNVTSTAPDGNLAAYLFATPADDPCGTSAVELARAHTDLRHRGSLTRGQPFPVGTPTEVDVVGAPFAARVPPGARLVLVLAGGDGVELAPEGLKPALVGGPGELQLPVMG
jgi:predicted acyl esterase